MPPLKGFLKAIRPARRNKAGVLAKDGEHAIPKEQGLPPVVTLQTPSTAHEGTLAKVHQTIDQEPQNSSYSAPIAQPATNVIGSTFAAGRDVNVIVNGNTNPSILHQLRSCLEPVAAAHDSIVDASKRRETCFQSTRVEILRAIGDWIHGQSPASARIYVLDGVAGIGKSTIAQTVAERAAKEGILGASFFFTRDEDERSTGTHAFPTIAYQLACHNSAVAEQVLDVVNQRPDIRSTAIPVQFSELILLPLQRIPHSTSLTLVVIDALDECSQEDAKTILMLLRRNIQSIPNLKVFITSRPEFHITDALNHNFTHERFHLHDIEDSVVRSDIQLYLDFYLSPDQVKRAFPHLRTPWQPTDDEKQKLYGICGTLFIIASTATKFILNNKRLSPAKQCSRLLEGVSSNDYSGSKRTDVLDLTYIQILRAASYDYTNASDATSSEDESWTDQYQTVLGAIIALQNPLPSLSLSQLLGVPTEDIEGTLMHLHSLVAPSGHNRVFRVHHKSFPDFIMSKERIRKALERIGCGENGIEKGISKFYLDPNVHHRNMTRRCFEVMRFNLKQNMCGINRANWYRDRNELEDAPQKCHIMPHVSYACLYWATHLYTLVGGLDSNIKGSLCHWASSDILWWLETLCIMDCIDASHRILDMASSAISCEERLTTKVSQCWAVPELLPPKFATPDGVRDSEEYPLDAVFSDCARLVRINASLLELSPLHIYGSAIPWTPVETPICKLYGNQATMRLIRGTERTWSVTWAILSGHSGSVESVAFSPDGLRVASGSGDKTVWLWNAKSGTHLSTLEGHNSSVTSSVFSPDSLRLASGSHDQTVRLWDAKSGSHLFTLEGHSSSVTSVAFSPDGLRLASGSADRTVRLWDAKSGHHLSILEGHVDTITSVAFSPDGLRLASGSDDTTIRLWNAKLCSYTSTLEGHSRWITSIAFSPDGLKLASGSYDGNVRLWDAKSGVHLSTLEGHTSAVMAIGFSPDGLRLASGSDAIVWIWDTKSGSHLSTLRGHNDDITSVAFSPDGMQLASGSADRTVRLWDINSDTHPSPLEGHSSEVVSIAFSPDGSRLASGSWDRTARLWDAKSGSHLSILEGHGSLVTSVAFSPDSLRLASGSADRTVRMWDAKSGHHLSTLQGHIDNITSVAFSPDGSQLASGSYDANVRLWDAKSGSHLSTFEEHSTIVTSVAFSPDGLQLASGSADRTLRLRDAKSGSCHSTLEGHSSWVTSVTFSPDGMQLASQSDDKTVRLWDARLGSHLSTLECLYDICNLAFFVPTTTPSLTHTTIGPHTVRPSLLLLVWRATPLNCYGLALLDDRCSGDRARRVVPICWFPPDVDVNGAAFAVSFDGSSVAIGCTNGRVLILDTSSIIHAMTTSC